MALPLCIVNQYVYSDYPAKNPAAIVEFFWKSHSGSKANSGSILGIASLASEMERGLFLFFGAEFRHKKGEYR